jgi:predicted small secreted protein
MRLFLKLAAERGRFPGKPSLFSFRPLWRGQIGDYPMRKLLLAGLVLASLAVSACNTIEGAGRDITAAGQAVQKTATDIGKH